MARIWDRLPVPEQHVAAVLATWPIAALLVHRDVLAEERQLTDRFRVDYVAYAAAVPRYLLLRTTGSGRESSPGCAGRPA